MKQLSKGKNDKQQDSQYLKPKPKFLKPMRTQTQEFHKRRNHSFSTSLGERLRSYNHLNQSLYNNKTALIH